ncbi:MAG: tetratricopeptide repeat protein [Myxococcales bacterium]|nr:tetratricopeptide repeat protein [Myxococcales bacterium]
MIIIYGSRMLGTVDVEDGTQQATRFAHVYYLPLIPLGSFELLGDDQGRPVPLNLKSVALAYGRVWGCVAVAGLIASTYLNLEDSFISGGVMTMVTLMGIALWALSILKLGVRHSSFGVPAWAFTLGVPLLALGIAVSSGVSERFSRMKWEAERGGGTAELAKDALRGFAKAAAEAEEEERLARRREKCDQGSGLDCNELGYALSKTDPVESLAAYAKGCDADFGMACFNQALVTKKTDPAAADALYTRACELSYANGCNNQAVALEKAHPAQAFVLFEKGCELKSGLACRNVARMVAQGTGTKKNVKQAKTLYAQACAMGDDVSCGKR